MKTLIIFLSLLSLNALAAPVNINKADAKTIAKSLNGIGMVKADAIVKYRKNNGSFTNLKELAKVKGIGAKILVKNKADIFFEKVQADRK